jgi:hypothetical protein
MTELIDSNIRSCVSYIKNPLNLYQTCRRAGDGYQVEVKRQVSGTFNDETIAFSASYRGADLADIDYSRVKLRSLSPVFARLCEQKRGREQATRAVFGP